MVQRNEDDAIITHGTMCMVRRSALEQVGGWGTDTICEDTELGLRLYEAGYQALYTNYRYGRGMLPDTFKAFKTQRFRWAYGAMQIIRKHWTHMLPGARTLTPAQKFHFVSGWSLWFSDALGTLASMLNLIWVPVIIFVGVVIPTIAFTVPILAAFVVNLLHCVLLYGKRVEVPLRQIPGCGDRGDEPAVDGGASGAGRHDPGQPAVPADREGRQRQAGERQPGVVGNRAGCLLLACSAVVLMLLNEEHVIEMTVFATHAFGAERSVPRRGGDGRDRTVEDARPEAVRRGVRSGSGDGHGGADQDAVRESRKRRRSVQPPSCGPHAQSPESGRVANPPRRGPAFIAPIPQAIG